MDAGRKTPDGRGTRPVESGADYVIMRKGETPNELCQFAEEYVNRPVISQTNSTVGVAQSVDAQAPLLRVYTFGAFHLDWLVLPFTTKEVWKSRTSARTLLKLLLCAPGRQASRSQLAGILWPETDEDNARESLRPACQVLRQVLRTASGEELLEQRNQGTILKLAEQSHLWVDADAFEDLISQAGRATTPDEALALWQQAKVLLRGEFLADDQGSEWMRHRWIKLRQQALRMARGRMVRHLADLYLQRGHVSLAEEVLEQQIIHFPRTRTRATAYSCSGSSRDTLKRPVCATSEPTTRWEPEGN